MEDLNELSNDELQYRLAQFGVPNLPVTATTRKVLIKRLRNLIDTEKSKLRRDTDNVTRYSSDEDVDTKRTPKSRARSTISPRSAKSSAAGAGSLSSGYRGRSQMPPPSLAAAPSLPKALPQPKKSNNSSVYISPLIQHDTDEESDQADGMNASLSPNRYRNALSLSISSAGSTNSRLYNGHDASSNAIGLGRYSTESAESGTPNSSFLHGSAESSTNGDQENDDLSSSSANFTKRLLSLRSRSLAGSAMNAPSMLASSKRYDPYSTSPLLGFQSGYAGDLSASRRSMYTRTSSIAYQAANADKVRRPFSIRHLFSDLWNRQYERYSMKQSFVPCILLSALFLFFTSVIIAYITMNPDLSLALDAQAATFKVCQPTADEPPHEFRYQPTVNCVEKEQMQPAFGLLKLLIPELQRRIVHNRCVDAAASFAMSAVEVMRFVLEQSQDNQFGDVQRALHNAEYLVSLNQQWRVGHFIDGSGQPSAAITLTQVVRDRPGQANYFAIVNPHLPVSCFLYKKLQAVFAIIGWLAVAAAVTLALVLTVRYIRGHLQSRRQRVTNMYEEIKSILMEKAFDPDTAQTDASFVVVSHLRDKLIPPNERSSMESVWNAAIKAIENDSRVQVACAIRNGEEYRLLRWVDTIDDLNAPTLTGENVQLTQSLPARYYTNASVASNNCAASASPAITHRSSSHYAHGNVKKWQSPAFDKSNKIKDPPTECLKIRQMFDKHEASSPTLKQVIQDSILEKVAHTTCRIYDLQLDKQTCCVYVRCASAKDAGIIHDEVNGWWFDRRLVSIKFLRMDRYLARFPASVTASGPACLKLSNTKNLSMTNGDDDGARQNGKRSADSLDDYDDDDLEREADT